MTIYKTSYRTKNCGEIRKENVSEFVKLAGWVNSVRDHGGLIFVDLRDRYGITQIVFRPEKKETFKKAEKLKNEFVISVTGTVIEREKDKVNPNLETGEIEIEAENLEILSESKELPFDIEKSKDVNETIRLKYRYLDLRRKRIQFVLKKRHDLINFVRSFFYEKDFIEIQTPLLTSSTPEGARDFVVPSRLHKGKFYALPQSPQQYKQLLMIAGFDRYFQVAPCLRDEDPRADRLYGMHYQFDIEMSFVKKEDIFEILGELYEKIPSVISPEKKLWKTPIPVFSYNEVMERYASDKPDLRYNIEIFDVRDIFQRSSFETFKKCEFVRAIQAPKALDKFSRTKIDEYVNYAKSLGANGLAWVKVLDSKNLDGGISKFIDGNLKEALIEKTKVSAGDMIFFVGENNRQKSNMILDKIRRKLGSDLGLIDDNLLAFLWVTDFPFFEWNEEERKLDFMHNPFSLPQCTLEELDKVNPLEMLANQYDMVCNGVELFSGGERNYNPKILEKVFQMVGYSKEEIHSKFGHMLEAFSFGAPPTAGAGMGVERLLMILLSEENVREVTAFPLDGKGFDQMMNAPNTLRPEQIKELGIKI